MLRGLAGWGLPVSTLVLGRILISIGNRIIGVNTDGYKD
jgi:hypothetical protein